MPSTIPPLVIAVPLVAQAYTTDITGGISEVNTWTQILDPISFDKMYDSPILLLVSISGNIEVELSDSTATSVAARVRIDDVGDYPFSGVHAPTSGSTVVNVLSGGGLVVIGGVNHGTHTLTIDLWADGALTYNCRAASNFPIESLAITILECK